MSIMLCNQCYNHFDSDYGGQEVDNKAYCETCLSTETVNAILEVSKGKYWNQMCLAVRGCTPIEEACDN